MMIVIRCNIPRKIAKSLKIKDVIAVGSDGSYYRLEVLNAHFDTKDQPSIELIKPKRRKSKP